EREHLTEHDDSGLRHRIQPGRLLAPDPGIGGDVDHASPAPGQVRVGVLRIEQAATDVDAHHPVVVGQRSVDQPRGYTYSRIVDQHVETAKVICCRSHRLGDRAG